LAEALGYVNYQVAPSYSFAHLSRSEAKGLMQQASEYVNLFLNERSARQKIMHKRIISLTLSLVGLSAWLIDKLAHRI